MRLYFEFFKNSLQVHLAYKIHAFISFAGRVITLLIQMAIWRALLKGATITIDHQQVVTLEEMMTYVLINSSITIMTSTWMLRRIDRKIKSGEIAIDLIRPLNFKFYMFTDNLGLVLFRIISELIPILVMSTLWFKINYPGLAVMGLFGIVLVNGFIIDFLIIYTVGLLGFWFQKIVHMGRVLEQLQKLFSGAFIPLWFFPDIFKQIALYFPFRLIYFAPAAIFLGKISLVEGYWIILQQWLWISGLWTLERFVWSRSVQKLVVQGG